VERRTHPRIGIFGTGLYSKDVYPRLIIASIFDLSVGGTKIESLYSLNKGEGLELSIAMGQKAMRFRGQVRYVLRQEGGKLRAGVEFDKLPDSDRLYLREYIAYLLEQQT
jgi:hypothetical protein